MRRSAAVDLLELWEHGSRCGAQVRALHLLAWALPDHDFDVLADFDLGLRDWHLLRLRCALFGPALSAYADCPHCGERLEIELDAHALQGDAPMSEAPHYVSSDGRRFRLPSSRDLIAVSDLQDTEVAAGELFRRCGLDEAAPSGSANFEEVDDGLAALAAGRALRLELACGVCNADWGLDFDPGAFVWEEIQARSLALLDDVHKLASAYGWSESKILALGNARRAAYLSRVS